MGARQTAGGERSEPPELDNGGKSPGRGETILSLALSGLLYIRIHTGGSQKVLAPGHLSWAPPGRLRLTVVLQQLLPVAPTDSSGGKTRHKASRRRSLDG